MVVTDRFAPVVLAVMLFQAARAMNGVGKEILRAIQCQKVALVEIAVGFQDFATLQFAEDVLEARTQFVGCDPIEKDTHLRVAGDAVDAIDGTEVVVVTAVFVVPMT